MRLDCHPACPTFVCVVPTGGGKTLLACYAAGLAMDQLMRAEREVGALWASRSGGRCLSVLPTENDFMVIAKAIRPL